VNILVIDDEKWRHDFFEDSLKKISEIKSVCIHHATDAIQALQLMHSVKFDLVFFDYDLGYGDSGLVVARVVLGLCDGRNAVEYNRPSAVWIHSQSREGQRIESIFMVAGILTHRQSIDDCMGYPESFVEGVLHLLGLGKSDKPEVS